MSRHGMRWVERIERTPLAWPMAALMAAAVAFLVYAVPRAVVMQVLPMAFTPLHRAAAAAALALVAGGTVWALFDRLDRPRAPRGDADDELEIDLFAPVLETTPQLRRADTHPDAPACRPVFAAADLGAPMDDVDRGATPFGRPPLFHDVAQPAGDAGWDDDTLLLDSPWSGPQDGDVPETAPVPDPVPRPDPAPIPMAPVPVAQETIAGLMARLERGLAARGGDVAAGEQRAADDGLREALDELRRMTSGR